MHKRTSICTHLMQIGYSSRTLHRVPLLLAKNKKLRLQFKLAGEQAELGDA